MRFPRCSHVFVFTRASRIPRSATAQSHTHTLHAPREYLEVRQIVLTLTLTLCTRLANTSKCDRSCSPPFSHARSSRFEVRQFTPHTSREYLEVRQLEACFLHLSNFVPARGFRVKTEYINKQFSGKFGQNIQRDSIIGRSTKINNTTTITMADPRKV